MKKLLIKNSRKQFIKNLLKIKIMKNYLKTHNDTKKLYKKSNLSFYIGLILLFPFTFFICLIYLYSWNNEHLQAPETTIEIPKIYVVRINKVDTVIYEYSDRKEARIQYEYCRPLRWDSTQCRNENEIINIVLDK